MPKYIVQPRPQVIRSTHWGEPKRCRSISMTDTAHQLLSALAEREGINNSEYVERAIRKLAAEAVDDLNRPQ